jgi:ATP/maltotriose-dependent transcriptional regulator MalT
MTCEQYELEKENIRAAYGYALRNDVPLALEIATNLRWVYYFGSRLREGEEMVVKALQNAGQSRCRAVWPALVTLGALRCWMDDFAGAREPLDAALEGLEPDQARERRHALAFSGWAAMFEGDFDRAFVELDEARQRYEEHDETWSVAACLNLMGFAACFAGRHAQARELFGAGRVLALQTSDRSLAAHCLLGLGRIAWLEANLEESEAHYRAALSGFRDHRDKRGTAYAIEGLARLAASRGDYEMAMRLTGAAQGLRDEISLRRDPMDQEAHDAVMQAARRELDADTLAAEYEAGRRIGDRVEELHR